MKRIFYPLLNAALISIPFQLGGHSIFFQAESHYTPPQSNPEILVFCGTLAESEISIQPDTLKDIRVHGPSGIDILENTQLKPYVTQSVPWRIGQRISGKLGGFDRRRISTFDIQLQNEGSYVLTTDLFPYHLAKTPVSWAEWMEELFMVETAASNIPTQIGNPSLKGRYHKSIKTFIQVGDKTTDNTTTAKGLTTEILPDVNPRCYDSRKRIFLYSNKPRSLRSESSRDHWTKSQRFW